MLRAVVVIPSPHCVALGVEFAARAELDMALARLLELKREECRAGGRGIIDHDAEVVKIYRIAIGRRLLVVVTIVVARGHILTHEGHHHQNRALTMRGHIQRQAAHTVGRELVVVGVHAKHRVGQLARWVGGYQKMRNVADAVVHIIHHLALCTTLTRHGAQRHKGYKESSHWGWFLYVIGVISADTYNTYFT